MSSKKVFSHENKLSITLQSNQKSWRKFLKDFFSQCTEHAVLSTAKICAHRSKIRFSKNWQSGTSVTLTCQSERVKPGKPFNQSRKPKDTATLRWKTGQLQYLAKGPDKTDEEAGKLETVEFQWLGLSWRLIPSCGKKKCSY
jgi:hypothetical protein